MKKYFLLFILICAFAFLANQLFIPTNCPQKITKQADAIVVFTGDFGRIDAGLKLLQQGKAKKLLISGVHQNTKLENITKQSLKCCIELDYQSKNTKENVIESNKWLEEKNFNSIILITSDYHMPRSLAEFFHINPALDISPYCIVSEKKFRPREYAKYIITKIRNTIEK